jgi:glycyl-tRNA synthetase beta chain
MGKHYARFHGLGDGVADAIEQHWWPKGQGAELPRSIEAAIVALADKMDTITGCFAVGLEPSGSADPFGLRRAAIGIWQILLARPELSFDKLFATARAALAEQGVTLKDPGKLEDYFRQRLQGIFVDTGIPVQDASAALAQGFHDPNDARARALACAKISKEAREVFKRVANILDDARGKNLEPGSTPDPALFVAADNVEHALFAAITEARGREQAPRAARDYAAVFESLERLRPTVAAFFDKGGVMVMDPDPKLRDNRLALLHWFLAPYLAIADFRLLASAGGNAS